MNFDHALAGARVVLLINLVYYMALLAAVYMRPPQTTIRQSLVIFLSTTAVMGLTCLAIYQQDGTALMGMLFAQELALGCLCLWILKRREKWSISVVATYRAKLESGKCTKKEIIVSRKNRGIIK